MNEREELEALRRMAELEAKASGGFAADLDAANESVSRGQMSHPAAATPTPKDIYARQAQSQSFLQNLGAGAGGAIYGMGYLGPKSMLGKADPGEVADWKASMAGLSGTGGGVVGQVLGYASPAAVAAPFVGTSVPIAAAIGAGEGLLMPAEGMAERAANVVASAAGATLGQAGVNALGRRVADKAAQRAAEVGTRRSQNAVRDATLKQSQAAGYVVPPSYAGSGMWPRFFEGISGKIKTNQLAGIKNQKITNVLAKRDLGLPEDSALSDAVLDDLRKRLAQPYRDIAALPQVQTVKAASNYTDWDAPVQAVRGFDPAEALENLKQARFDAKTYWKHFDRTGEPESLLKARELDSVVDQIETGLENHARQNGRPDLVDALRDARRQIAKTYTVERALNDATGDVDATALARMLARNEPVTGDLNTAGKFGMGFHDVARVPNSGDANPVTALDFLFNVPSAGLGAMAWGAPGAMALSMLPTVMRTGSRYSLLSGPGQKLLSQPKYSLGMGRHLAPALQSRLAQELAQGAGIYGYGVQPGLQD